MSVEKIQPDVQSLPELGFLSLAETISALIVLIQGDKLVYVNPAACAMLGYPPGSFIGRNFWDVVHPDDRDAARARGKARQAGIPQPKRLLERLIHADGHAVWVDYSVDLIQVDGRPTILTTGFDVTERLKAEEALRLSEERFRDLLAQAPVLLIAFTADKRIRDVSDYWLETMGYRREEVVGQPGFQFLSPESQIRLQEAAEENGRHHQKLIKNFPLRAIRKDGSTIDVLSTSVADLTASGECRGVICVSVDLTDIHRAEAALRESEERYRALVEYAPEAILVMDAEKGLFVDANEQAVNFFGWPRERLLTMGPRDFCPEGHGSPEDPGDTVKANILKVCKGETPVFDASFVTAAGRPVHCQTRLSRLPAAGRQLVRVTITDITELRQLQEKVRHAEKLAAVGILAAGVAHEIGNPLMALSQAAQSLERRSCDDYAKAKLALIGEHIERICRIVRQMSNLAHPHNGDRKICDLNQVIRRSVDIVRYDKRSKGTEVLYELSEGLPATLAVEDELIQVFINLALNAFDAMADNPPGRPRRLTIRSSASPSAVRISFLDSGPGVPSEIRPNLFQPFFTTKEAGRGTGLGLSVSYRILQEHRGSLRLEDDGAPGAHFVLELPIGSAP